MFMCNCAKTVRSSEFNRKHTVDIYAAFQLKTLNIILWSN